MSIESGELCLRRGRAEPGNIENTAEDLRALVRGTALLAGARLGVRVADEVVPLLDCAGLPSPAMRSISSPARTAYVPFGGEFKGELLCR